MKKFICILLSFIVFNSNKPALQTREIQDLKSKSKKKVNNNAFKVGEKLEYTISYGFFNAARASLEVKSHPKKIKGREVVHIVGKGKSISAFDWFFKIRDRYETYIDKNEIIPMVFVRRVNEGGYKKAQDYFFDHKKGMVKTAKEESFIIPYGVQDMLSAFYYARTMNYANAKKGDIFTIKSFVDGEIFPIKIAFGGRKIIKIDKGKYNCLVFHPRVQEGRVFKTKEDLTFYISDDENKIPILLKANVKIGSLKMELTHFKNLVHPLARVEN